MAQGRRTGHLANVASQERLKQRERQRERQAQEDLAAVMALPAGRRFVWLVIDGIAGVSSRSFDPNAHVTAYNDGRRSVGIRLQVDAQRHCTDDYVRMIQEQLAAQAEDQLHRKDAENAPEPEVE